MSDKYTLTQLAGLPHSNWNMIVPVAGIASGIIVKVDRKEVLTRAIARENTEKVQLVAIASPVEIGDTSDLLIHQFTTLPQ